MKVWTVYTYVHINNSDVLYIFVIKFSFINCCLQLVLESVNPAVVFRYSGSEGAWPQMFLLILDLWIWTSAETHWPILKLGDAAFNVCESCCFLCNFFWGGTCRHSIKWWVRLPTVALLGSNLGKSFTHTRAQRLWGYGPYGATQIWLI